MIHLDCHINCLLSGVYIGTSRKFFRRPMKNLFRCVLANDKSGVLIEFD